MKFEDKMKKRGNQKLNEFAKNPYYKPRFPSWAKLAIPISSVALSCGLALTIILPLAGQAQGNTSLFNSALDSNVSGQGGTAAPAKETASFNALTRSKVQKVKENFAKESLSPKTYQSYMAFTKNFTSLVMETNNKEKEDNLGISIPDAYLCIAISGIISDQDCLNDVLSYFELSSYDELKTAIKEILFVAATLVQNQYVGPIGGYNLNSVWLNPDKVRLIKQKDEELYKDLEQIFDATIFMEALTSEKANLYLKDYGLKDLPTPEVKLNDGDPSAISVMSTYYCLDTFAKESKEEYYEQYLSKNHKMDYTYNGVSKKVDYIKCSETNAPVYENDNFYGAGIPFTDLRMNYFLPNDVNAMPSSILNDVLDKNYHEKEVMITDPYSGEEIKTTDYTVSVSAPYFLLNNEIELDSGALSPFFPNLTSKGAGARIAESKSGLELCLSYIKQFSVMKFNYEGFYSCSVTIAGMDESAYWEPNGNFSLVLDHPYLFEVVKNVDISSSGYQKSIPLVIGEIVNPEYQE